VPQARVGRRSHSRSLSVWINAGRVGRWTQTTQGESQFVYDDAWTSRLDTNPLSLSLPYGDLRRGAVVQNYFDNLLPDSESLRNRLAHRLGASSPATFDLLAAAGRDCVGAVQLLGEDESPIGSGQINGQPMTESDVERLLLHIQDPRAPNADADELRISLAGAQ
jgi:serine/threonine-protein kinase HipA